MISFFKKLFCRNSKAGGKAIVDAQAISDGRIFKAAKSKFLAFEYVIPQFVIDELKILAASKDASVRNSAKRGLDVADKMLSDETIKAEKFSKLYKNITSADSKLIQAAQDLNAKIITADFNLARTAAASQVAVLNINDLAAATAKIFLPGDAMTICLAKEGSQHNQAVGYLDDGTMVVAEEGKKFVGKRVVLAVTSVIQTSSGKMIFGKIENEVQQVKHSNHHKLSGHL